MNNPSEFAAMCARELKAHKDLKTGKPLTDYERGLRAGALTMREVETQFWRYKQQFENVKENYKKEKPAALQFQQHNYSKSDLKAIFADNDIFGGN